MGYSSDRSNTIVLVTDGAPSQGILDEADILDSLRAWNTQHVSIYQVVVGDELSKSLMRGIAKQSTGFSTEINDADSITVLVAEHLKRISMPHLSNLALDYGGLETYDVLPTVLPTVLPNCQVGGRVLQVGRYEAGGLRQVTLTGTSAGAPFTLQNSVLVGDPNNSKRAVARL